MRERAREREKERKRKETEEMLTALFHECSKLKHVCTPRPVLLRGGEKGEEVLFLTPPPLARNVTPAPCAPAASLRQLPRILAP